MCVVLQSTPFSDGIKQLDVKCNEINCASLKKFMVAKQKCECDRQICRLD